MEFWRTHRRLLACVAAFSLLGPQLAQAAALGIDSVRSSPRGWSVQSSGSLPDDVQAMEAATISQLFDRDTDTEYTAFDDQSVQVTLQDTRQVTAIRVFGAAPYRLTVQEKISTGWRDIQGLKGLDLTQLSETWHTFETNNPATTDTLRLQLTQSGSSASGLRELEIWSHGEHVPVETGSQLLALLADAVLADQAGLASATRTEGLIGSGDAAVPDDASDNTFDIPLDIPASQIKYAWLVYETLGLDHWASAVRVINDQPAVGGVAIHTNDAWNEQLERVSPAWLRQGTNRVRFAVPSGSNGQYRVRNVRLLVETDNGANFVSYLSASQTDDSVVIDRLYDGDADTGMVVYSGDAVGGGLSEEADVQLPRGLIDNPGNGLHLGWSKGNAPWKQALQGAAATPGAATFEMGFDRGVELEAVGFYLRGKLAGKIDVELYHSGDWHPSGMPSVSANALKNGWNDIAIADGNRVQGVRLLFTGGEGSSGEIRELSVRGSGIGGAWLPPDVIVTYPDAGQYYGREAYLRGFLQGVRNESGEAQLFIAGQPLNHVNGEFQTLVSKDDAGFGSDADATPWTVTVEAVYPDGSRTATIVPLFANQGALEDGAQAGMPPVTWLPITPGTGGNAGIPGAGIVVDPGAVDENLDISMMPLGDLDIAALDTWMTNVTAPNAGYRFLPHGKHFKKKIEVRIKYQPSLLPPGFTEDDIRTFYFDEQAGKWKELEVKEIDKAKQEVVALTDHFTDMVNAVIQVPDSPQNTQFNPTQIKDIKAADPGAKINLIEPPQANNMGDARVSYPIEVPPGRRGMQPQLAVQYNSGGGHTWLGHGWDIGMQSISIDTRWGVPRYDEQKETETYLLNGEQLTPLAHVGELLDRESDKQFHTRVEGAFQKIIRHGDSPKNYWWEVIDKNGTQYFYGGDDTASRSYEESTLRTEDGEIGKWVLRLVRDSNGNEIHYQTVLVEDSGIGNGSGGVLGQQVYLDKIYYTGYQGQQGEYEVSFVRDREQSGFDPQSDRRPDVSIDARLGLKQVTADLLKRIDVRYDGQLVRAYTFDYKSGAYEKSLLTAIHQLDDTDALFNTHNFEYYDEVRNEQLVYQPLPTLQDWATSSNGIDGGLRVSRAGFDDNASATSGIVGRDSGNMIAVTIGAFDGNLGCKSNTVGGHRGSSKSESEGLLAFVDINGDSLPDKVFQASGGLKYRAGTADGGVSSDVLSVVGLPGFQRDISRTKSKGVQATFGCGVSGNVGVSKTSTLTEQRTYFTDANGDGLIDVVVNGKVYFNHIDANGRPRFTQYSSDTPNTIGASAPIAGGLVEDNTAELEAQIDENPLHDVVRVWIAPFSGNVEVSAPVALLEDTSEDRQSYEGADGVVASIQHKEDVLWRVEIAADDYQTKAPSDVDQIPVQAGDRLYFRLQSVVDGSYDQVSWSPEVRYLDVPLSLDSNGLDLHSYQAGQDFLAAALPEQTVSAPIDGTVFIDGIFQKPATSDDVSVLILQNGEIVWQRDYSAAEVVSISPDLSLSVQAEDAFTFLIQSDTTLAWNAMNWIPRIYYTAFDEADISPLNEDGEPQVVVLATPSMRLFSRDIVAVRESWQVPTEIQVVENVATGTTRTVVLEQDHDVSVTVQPSATFNRAGEPLVFSVKKEGQLIAKMPLVVLEGQVFDPSDLPPEGEPVVIEDLPFPKLTFAAKVGEQYWFEYHAVDERLAVGNTQSTVLTELTNLGEGEWEKSTQQESTVALRTIQRDIRFGHQYRHWGQFAWNGNRDRAEQPIIESELNLDSKSRPPSTQGYADIDDGEELEDKFDNDGYNPADDLFVLMYPYAPEQAWQGYDDLTWIGSETQSSSRFGVDSLDTPNPVASGDARAVIKLVRNESTSYSLGGAAGPVSAGAGKSEGKIQSLIDYIDMNGDRYPDVVGLNSVQYTAMHGGLEASPTPMNEQGVSSFSDTKALSANLGGSVPLSDSVQVKSIGGTSAVFRSSPPSVGISGSVGKSEDAQQYGWSDVNGDGLPDRIYKNGTVALNLGYRFAEPEQWGVTTKRGESNNDGVSLGFNIGAMSIAGGLSLNRSDTEVRNQLFDMNGDGLPDLVDATQSPLKVALNTGNGFLPYVDWTGARSLNQAATVSEGGNIAFTVCVPLIPPFVGAKACINPSKSYSKSMSREERSLHDINGDGYPDYVESQQDGEMKVRLNAHGRTNLLKSVQRPLGASFEIDYERAGNTYEMPQNKWVMSKVTVHDGFAGDGPDTQVTTFAYADGYHDRRERDFFGFATVVVEERDTRVTAMPVYRSVTQTYHNTSIYERGLLAGTVMRDGSGNPYTESRKTYRFVNVSTQQPIAREALPAQQSATIFPQVAEETSRFFEGEQQPGKQTRVAYLAYDAVGNVTHFVDYADVGAADDVEAKIRYFYDEASWIMAAAESIKVYGNGTLMRQRESTIEPGTGNVKDIRQSLENGVARYDFDYYPHGNLKSVTGPANLQGERYNLRYGYDTRVHTHVTRIEDSFGYVSTASPNFKWGQVEESVDINNQKIRTTFDSVGRVTTITGPYEQQSGQATITFTYHPKLQATDPLNWALTQHHDPQHPGDRIETALFTDGLKRVLQTKKDGTVGDGNGAPKDVMIVSGRVLFDHAGRSIEQYYPVTEPLGSAGSFNASVDPVPPTRTEHDVLDRPLKVTIPDGTATTFRYDFGADRDGRTQFRTTVTDANGVRKDSFRDVRQLITAVKEYNKGGSEILWASYRYDPLKQITDVFDAQNNLTRAEYDLLGRRTVLDNPDTGKVEMIYDPAGNLIKKITPNLRAKGEAIEYGYRFNRLETISYPEFSGNNVTYEYGAPNAQHNAANRIIKMTDQAGWETRAYGPLGELTESTRNIQWAAGPAESYTTKYQYDTWNRLTQLTYPDGEVLTYRYNTGGQMSTVQGKKGSYDYHYVQQLHYDKFEQRTYLLYGNNTETRYVYDPFDRRLAHLTAGKGAGSLFMDLSYEYDRVGNITELANAAEVNSPNMMGGKTSFSYQYDDLYRLTDSTGTFDTKPDKQHAYTLSMQYDTIHNIKQKTQLHTLRQPGGQKITQQKTSYDWVYQYDGQQPHAPTHLGDRTFSYDANGNQLGWTHDKNGTRRQIVWDEENRIQNIQDNGHTFTYTYDGSGQRMTKRGPQGETGYINQWMTLRNGEIGTKHVFAGTTRVVSKLVKQDKPNSKRNSEAKGDKARIVYEKDQYYFHPDHLGTTAYITHTNGQVYQHLEYFPFGETWVEEHSNKQRTPYQFTGKELDEETKLYYFGARYYDPRMSVWQSPDPIDRFGSHAPALSLNLYQYGLLNPLRYSDPTGTDEYDEIVKEYRQKIGAGRIKDKFDQDVQPAFDVASDVATGLNPISTAQEMVSGESASGQELSWWERIPGLGKAAVVLGVAKVASRAPTRFIDGVKVVDRRTGNAFEGTVDLKPTLDRIKTGEKYPHRNDGGIFQNHEGLLPQRPDGYYKEYVHPTPGIEGVGPQRIVVGQGGEMFYTPDHYDTFIPIN